MIFQNIDEYMIHTPSHLHSALLIITLHANPLPSHLFWLFQDTILMHLHIESQAEKSTFVTQVQLIWRQKDTDIDGRRGFAEPAIPQKSFCWNVFVPSASSSCLPRSPAGWKQHLWLRRADIQHNRIFEQITWPFEDDHACCTGPHWKTWQLAIYCCSIQKPT